MRLEEYEFCALEDIPIPPFSNTGVTNSTESQKYSVKYDWFEGLINTKQNDSYMFDLEQILTSLDIGYDGVHDTRIQGNFLANKKRVFRQKNWEYAYAYLANGIPLMTISYGGSNAEHGDYFQITGQNAHLIVDTLKNYFRSVSGGEIMQNDLSIKRVDVAIDVRGDFDFIVNKAMSSVDEFNLKVNNAGDWLTKKHDGRTLYLKKSQNVQLRIYEKGYEQRDKGIQDAPLDWVRLELEVRVPKGRQNQIMKKTLAAATASDIFHSYHFAVSIMSSVLNLELDYSPIQYTTKPEPLPIERLLQVLAIQYGAKLTDLLETKDGFNQLIESLYPDQRDIPEYLRALSFQYIEKQNHLIHGEY